MPVFLDDAEINRLLQEPKPLPADHNRRLMTRPKRGHREVELDVTGEHGSEFRLILRESEANSMDFSAILAYQVPNSSQVLRLRRYNGKSHEHSNPLEGDRFYGFHIHEITERYQQSGNREDTYAQPTDRYSNVQEAVDCLLTDCAFERPPGCGVGLF